MEALCAHPLHASDCCHLQKHEVSVQLLGFDGVKDRDCSFEAVTMSYVEVASGSTQGGTSTPTVLNPNI